MQSLFRILLRVIRMSQSLGATTNASVPTSVGVERCEYREDPSKPDEHRSTPSY
jgi:hypothetical protein